MRTFRVYTDDGNQILFDGVDILEICECLRDYPSEFDLPDDVVSHIVKIEEVEA